MLSPLARRTGRKLLPRWLNLLAALAVVPAACAWGADPNLLPHTITLREDGRLLGRVRLHDTAGDLAPVRARVAFLQQGRTVARTVTDEQGLFSVSSVPPGVYAFVAVGPSGLGVCGLRVDPTAPAEKLPLPDDSLPAKGVAGRDESDARFDVFGPGGVYDVHEADAVLELTLIPMTSLSTTTRLVDQLLSRGDSFGSRSLPRSELWGVPVSTARFPSPTVELDRQGKLRGRLMRFGEDGELVPARVNLFFLRGEEIVSHTQSNEQGYVDAVGLSPGVYSLVAVGHQGFAAFAVRLIRGDSAPGNMRTVAARAGAAHPLASVQTTTATTVALTLIQPGQLDPVMDLTAQETSDGDEEGGFVQGTTGGGGGIGGTAGGLGDLLGALGAAAGITALATNTNNK